MSRKERKDRMPGRLGFNVDRAIKRQGRKLDEVLAQTTAKIRLARELTPQDEILQNEDDLSMLALNQREYTSAVLHNQADLSLHQMFKMWGGSEEEIKEIVKSNQGKGSTEATKAAMSFGAKFLAGDKRRLSLFNTVFKALISAPRFYKDELDVLVDEHPDLAEGVSDIELLEGKLRSERETLALIRMQIDYLKKKQKEARRAAQTPKKDRTVKTVGSLGLEVAVTADMPTEPEQPIVDHEKVIKREPYGLSNWRVFWSSVKFSDSKNHLRQLPTDSHNAFLESLEEINKGKREFRIKTSSVVSCMEMWEIPEYRDRVMAARLRWGPPQVLDWGKIVRGDVRIYAKNNEENREVIFFALDRDEVYRHIFAGMST